MITQLFTRNNVLQPYLHGNRITGPVHIKACSTDSLSRQPTMRVALFPTSSSGTEAGHVIKLGALAPSGSGKLRSRKRIPGILRHPGKTYSV